MIPSSAGGGCFSEVDVSFCSAEQSVDRHIYYVTSAFLPGGEKTQQKFTCQAKKSLKE